MPASAPELAASIREGLARHRLIAREVIAAGDAFPALETLSIDLTDARATREIPLPQSVTPGSASVAINVFDLTANPLFLESLPIDLNLHAEKAVLRVGTAANGESLLTFASAVRGELTLAIARTALEAAIQKLAAVAAKEHGVEIRKTQLELTSRGPRGLSVRAEVGAKMFLMSASATLTGELDIDDQLNARISDLHCRGHGMAAAAASGFIQPYLARYNGRTFPLMTFSLGEVKLRELHVAGGETLRLRASFS